MTRSEITPEMRRYADSLMIDNVGDSKRKLGQQIIDIVFPLYRKLFRTVAMPSGLVEREEEDLKKIEWPKGRYSYAGLKKATKPYESVPVGRELDLSILDKLSHPWNPSLTYDLDLDLFRNRRSLRHGAGPPKMGSKRDHINDAKLYNESIKGAKDTEDWWSVIAGYRAQKRVEPGTPIEDIEPRLIWGLPVHVWLKECEAYDSAITRTIEATKAGKTKVFVFYTEASILQNWYKDQSGISQWVNLDATQFDASVTAPELSQVVNYFAPEYPEKDLLAEYLISAQLIMPEEIVSRSGGMPSGSKITNLGDGFVNYLDMYEAFRRYKLDKYIEAVVVNGDDISFGLSTKLTTDNLNKLDIASRRTFNSSKVAKGDFLWNSSLFCNGDIICATVGKTLNNAVFTERMKSAIYGSKEMTELKLAQQTIRIESNPIGPQIIAELAKLTKYHISEMSDEQLTPAAEMLEADSFEETSAKDIIQKARSSLYAERGR